MVEAMVKVGNIILLSSCDVAHRSVRRVVRGRTTRIELLLSRLAYEDPTWLTERLVVPDVP